MATNMPGAVDTDGGAFTSAAPGSSRKAPSLAGNIDGLIAGLIATEKIVVGPAFVNIMSPDYAGGATGVGLAHDDAPAIQAAHDSLPSTGGVIFVPRPPSFFNLGAELLISKPIFLLGSGVQGSQIRSSVGNLFMLATSNASFFGMMNILVRSAFGGGHVITQSALVSQILLFNSFLQQDNAAKSIWDNNGFGMLELDALKCRMDCHPSCSVPPLKYVTPTSGNINRNTLQGNRFTCGSGAPFIYVEGQDNSGWQYDLFVRENNFENPIGGMIDARSVSNFVFENNGSYDLTTSNYHQVNVTTGAGAALPSRTIRIRNYRRKAGTLGAGQRDLHLSGSDIVVDGVGNDGGAVFEIDWNSASGLYIGDGNPVHYADNNVTKINPGGNITVQGGGLNAGRRIYPATDGNALQTVCGIYGGNGVPNNANGNNGDYYFRGDGTVAGATCKYHKEAGVWVPSA